MPSADPEGKGGLENHRAIGFFSYTVPGPLESHKAIKPAFNVGPAFSGILILSSLPLINLKKNNGVKIEVGPPLTPLSGSAHECHVNINSKKSSFLPSLLLDLF